MIILHGASVGALLCLWGEAPAQATSEPPRAASKPRRRRKAGGEPERSPYDATADALVDAAGALDASLARARPREAVAWLPTLGQVPVPSSGIVGPQPEAMDGVASAPWRVTALMLDRFATISFLAACNDRPEPMTGVILGEDIRYWGAALRVAGGIVARQRVLPGLAKGASGWRAVWRPVPAAEDGALLHRLAEGMPQAARAVAADGVAPTASAATVLGEFVGRAVDGIVRLSFDGGAPPLPSRRAASCDDRWLAALLGRDDRIEGAPAELERLARRAADWCRPLTLTTTAPLRLCFRLEEPEAEPAEENGVAAPHGAWLVRYLVQDRHDPSLLVSAAELWSGRGRAAQLLARHGLDPRELLLVALGLAARLCPEIEASLGNELAEGFTTDAQGAVAFLTQTAMALEQAGFGVMLPAWWTRRGGMRLAARAQVASPKMQGGGGLTLDAVMRFEWQVALGEDRLSLRDLRALARLKAPLVRRRGEWVLLDANEIKEAIALLERKGDSATVREILRMGLGGESAARGRLAVERVDADGWIADILKRLDIGDRIEALAAPDGFAGALRPYQGRGYAWLSFLTQLGFGACLADDMGLGKTVQTLAFLQRHKSAAPGDRAPVLLVCPTSVIGNWQREAARFAPRLRIVVHHGVERAKQADFAKALEGCDLVLTSYSLAQRDLELLQAVAWRGVVLDEAQNVKNAATKQARAVRALRAGFRIALTGTPVENSVGDLWSLMAFLNPGWLGAEAEFKRSYFLPIQASRDADAIARLKALTGPLILRRLKTDRSVVSDLPEKMEMTVYCTLTREQASLYQAVTEEALATIEGSEGIERKGVVLATLAKLKQVCNHPAQLLKDNSAIEGRSGKLARLAEMLEEVMALSERTLIFTQFAEMGELLKRHLEARFGREALFLHGGVPRRQRDAMVVRFQSDDRAAPPFFILSLKAGGTGLNLTAANHVFHFDRWWNPAVENQATDRAFRIGQQRRVEVHKFVCMGTVEERIDDMIQQKKALADAIVGSGEAWLTELSTRELRSLFALRHDAVAA